MPKNYTKELHFQSFALICLSFLLSFFYYFFFSSLSFLWPTGGAQVKSASSLILFSTIDECCLHVDGAFRHRFSELPVEKPASSLVHFFTTICKKVASQQ